MSRAARCLEIWTAAGVTVRRHGDRFELEGMERPSWFDKWTERNRSELRRLVKDSAPPVRPFSPQ